MKPVLIACEYSGIVRDAFLSAGYPAVSCDLLPSSVPGPHVQNDCLELAYSGEFSAVIGFPPCTFVAHAGLSHIYTSPGRYFKMLDAAAFFRKLYLSPVDFVALENPPGAIPRLFRNYDQLVQPWYFGDPWRKQICLWLRGLPPLLSTGYSTIRKHRVNQTNGRMSQVQKAKIKSLFYPGVASAMVHQWGPIIFNVSPAYLSNSPNSIRP